ncbi:polysaccharide deacetylase family protein [Streptomyces sp. NBC_01485]|uniref:polysaccharide deacetylase family protein n=1 Tax=Streptomyces sp. NBC_01485 TaxID=2903884 RepID=UPI002E349DD2|nr:polysaccharide deacetylase family protein [Streptomyces sp. NBC_01485]
MKRRSLGIAVLAATALATTTACSSSSGSDTNSPAAGGDAKPAAAKAGSADPAAVTGLRIFRDGSEDPDCPWAVSYPAVPGADPLTAAMKADSESRLGDPLAEDAGCKAINISHDLLVASGDVLGVRLTTLDYQAAGDGTDTRTYWYDGKAGKARKAATLISDDSFDDFTDAVKDRLKDQKGIIADRLNSLAEYRDSTLDDLSFTTDGDLIAEFDRGTVAVPTGGRYQAVIPAEEATPLLSDFGRRAQKQATDPSDSLDLGVSAKPLTPPTGALPADSDVDCSQAKCLALTFDDGPGADTARLLDILAANDAHATFFVVGQNAAAHPDLLRAMAKAGHEIGNHSWSHADLTRLGPTELREQISRTNDAVKAATGKNPTLLRPPYGAVNPAVKAAAGLPIALWNYDTEDWKYRDSTKVADSVLNNAKPGDIVLLHDIHPTSVDAVPRILTSLKEQGYHFVTVSHLRADLKPAA